MISKILNNYNENEKLRKILFYFTILTMFGLVFFLTSEYPLLADDYDFSYIYWTYTPLSSFSDVLMSVGRYFMNWSGRVTGIFFAQTCLWIGKSFFNIANSVVYCVFILLLYKLTVSGRKYDAIYLVILNLLMWAFNPSFEESVVWLTGSCVYIWCFIFSLAVLVPYKKYLMGENISNKKAYIVWIFIAALISGNAMENLAAGFLCFAVGTLVVSYKREKKLQPALLAGFIGALIGLIVDLTAPGTANRTAVTAEHAVDTGFSTLYTYISRMNNITICFNDFMLPLIIATAVLFVMHIYFKSDKKVLLTSAAFSLFSIACAYCMILSPSFPLRTWLPVLMTLAISTGILYNNMPKHEDLMLRISCVIILFSLIPFALSVRNFYLYINSDYVGSSIVGNILFENIKAFINAGL